jgi:hypothetical protein
MMVIKIPTRMKLLEFTGDTGLYPCNMHVVACFLEHRHACSENYRLIK